MAIWLVEPIGESNQGAEARFIDLPTRPDISNPDWHVSGPYASIEEAMLFIEAGESL